MYIEVHCGTCAPRLRPGLFPFLGSAAVSYNRTMASPRTYGEMLKAIEGWAAVPSQDHVCHAVLFAKQRFFSAKPSLAYFGASQCTADPQLQALFFGPTLSDRE